MDELCIFILRIILIFIIIGIIITEIIIINNYQNIFLMILNKIKVYNIVLVNLILNIINSLLLLNIKYILLFMINFYIGIISIILYNNSSGESDISSIIVFNIFLIESLIIIILLLIKLYKNYVYYEICYHEQINVKFIHEPLSDHYIDQVFV